MQSMFVFPVICVGHIEAVCAAGEFRELMTGKGYHMARQEGGCVCVCV